jgi:hypothetical protein
MNVMVLVLVLSCRTLPKDVQQLLASEVVTSMCIIMHWMQGIKCAYTSESSSLHPSPVEHKCQNHSIFVN